MPGKLTVAVSFGPSSQVGMISDDVQRIELEARKRALEEYKLRCQELRQENDALKQEKQQRETDALQIISFLRRDAERKDELIESLKSTINQQREVFTQQRDDERQQQADRVGELESQFATQEHDRQLQLETVERELRDLQEFKEQKCALEEKSRADEQSRHDMEEEHRETIAQMERKFFEEKGRLQKEYKQILAEMKKTSQAPASARVRWPNLLIP